MRALMRVLKYADIPRYGFNTRIRPTVREKQRRKVTFSESRSKYKVNLLY